MYINMANWLGSCTFKGCPPLTVFTNPVAKSGTCFHMHNLFYLILAHMIVGNSHDGKFVLVSICSICVSIKEKGSSLISCTCLPMTCPCTSRGFLSLWQMAFEEAKLVFHICVNSNLPCPFLWLP